MLFWALHPKLCIHPSSAQEDVNNATMVFMQAAAAAMLFWELYHGALPAARLALTLHNMDSQGECSQEEFGFTGAEIRKT